ncbi:MAG: PEP-utilizing enzyme, partial [Nanoarchaeota archaeon]|nr:PEP-utilizing enzyme [Nanoarchaeota archaeon]
WMLGEDIPDMDLFFGQIFFSGFTNELEWPSGRTYKKILSIHKGYHLWFYFDDKDAYEVGEHLVNKFIADPEFTVKTNEEIIKEADKLRAFSSKLPQEFLDRLSNEQLLNYYETHDQIHTDYYRWCWIPAAADMFHNNLTNALQNYLKTKNVGDKLNEYLTILTQPMSESLIQKEQNEFLEIAAKIQKDVYHRKLFKEMYRIFQEKDAAPFGLKTHTPEYEQLLEKRMDDIRDKIKSAIYKTIEKHYEKYFYIKYMWIGKEGVHSFNHYLKELTKFIGKNSDARKLIKEKKEEVLQAKRKKAALVKKLGIEKNWQTIFNSFGDFMVTKIYRRYAQIYAIYQMQPLLEEIARRLKISKMALRFMLKREVRDALLNGKINRKVLNERTKFCVCYNEKNKEEVFVGKKAEALAKSVETKVVVGITELEGQTGCVGKAQGIVKLIIRPSDMSKMNQGDILVSIATDPDIVPAMKKAAAIVTEQGGVTSHAAIVSREMNIPCLIGTKIATKVFKDGDLVEVDANKGIVRKIR